VFLSSCASLRCLQLLAGQIECALFPSSITAFQNMLASNAGPTATHSALDDPAAVEESGDVGSVAWLSRSSSSMTSCGLRQRG
jgi:hypothetical protein